MRRRLFQIAAAVSSMLFAAICVAWIRSYWTPTTFTHAWSGGDCFFTISTGRREIYLRYLSRNAGDQLDIPYLPVLLLLLLTPSRPLIRRFDRRLQRRMRLLRLNRIRRNRGRCIVCGYDIRATPYRCPECGAAPDKL